MAMIPVSQPVFAKNAKKYLNECIDTGWVSSRGPFVARFEKQFAKFIGTKYAVATTNGTSAIHLALSALGIGPGDEVIIPSLTMIATVLPIIYNNAKPVLVDVEPDTGNMDIKKIEEKITSKTKAIIPVHLHGHPVDMGPLLKLARKFKLFVVEDAAETHGAKYQYRRSKKWVNVGSLGNIGCFSFYANKIITTGEGGMAVTNNKKLAEKMSSLRNLARSTNKHFLHRELGFAYRLSNLQAALGVAQLEDAAKFVKRKIQIARVYTKLLKNVSGIILPEEKDYAKSVFWHYAILLKNRIERDKLAKYLLKHGVETRTIFVPLHQQPALIKKGLFKNEHYPVAEQLSQRGLCLPSGLALSDTNINYVSQLVKKFLS